MYNIATFLLDNSIQDTKHTVYIFQIVVSLRSQGSTISMAEIEIWVREDPEETEQTPYCNGVGAAYLIPLEDDKTVYTFDTVGL